MHLPFSKICKCKRGI